MRSSAGQNTGQNAQLKPKPWAVKQESLSYGVACCRRNAKGCPEILMICKRNTYAYINFTMGKYKSKDNNSIMKLLDKMTLEEKLDVLTLDFDKIWYRAWLHHTSRMGLFKRAKAQFETNFLLCDGGERLTKLIGKSKNGRLRWEIPKGRKKDDEGTITCAVREFEEETGNKKKSYGLIGFTPHKCSFIEEGVRYTYYYFLAHSYSACARVDLSSDVQCSEVSDVKWMDIATIKHHDFDGRLLTTCKSIFAEYKSLC